MSNNGRYATQKDKEIIFSRPANRAYRTPEGWLYREWDEGDEVILASSNEEIVAEENKIVLLYVHPRRD